MVDMSDANVRKIVTAALRFHCAEIRGAQSDVVWVVLGNQLDPRCDMHLSVLRRYHREWWLALSDKPLQMY